MHSEQKKYDKCIYLQHTHLDLCITFTKYLDSTQRLKKSIIFVEKKNQRVNENIIKTKNKTFQALLLRAQKDTDKNGSHL